MIESVPRDQLLARLLGELTEQLRQGRQPEVDALAEQHPDLAEELRELWAAAQIADAFSRPAAQPPREAATQAPPVGDHLPSGALGLPRSFGDYELLEELG